MLRVGLSLSVTWLRGGSWRDPGNRADELSRPELYAELAASAEAAALDFVLKPDALGLDTDVLRAWPGFTTIDPFVLLATVCAATTRIGLVPTTSTTLVPPYLAARQAQSLDLISRGRAGLNIVTSLTGAQNFGAGRAPDRDRQEQAVEFIELVQRLWRSYPAEAIGTGPRQDFADPTLVRPVDHHGAHFEVAGPLDVPAYSTGRIPVFQAGGSPTGQELAGRYADAVFAAAPDIASGTAQRGRLHELAAGHGRSVLVLPGLSIHLAETRTRARDLAELAAAPGGAAHWTVVGTAEDAVAQILERTDAGLDGFILLPGDLGSLELFLQSVVPRLAEAGLMRSSYSGTTLAEHLGLDPIAGSG